MIQSDRVLQGPVHVIAKSDDGISTDRDVVSDGISDFRMANRTPYQ
jgi:hypothetical protein